MWSWSSSPPWSWWWLASWWSRLRRRRRLVVGQLVVVAAVVGGAVVGGRGRTRGRSRAPLPAQLLHGTLHLAAHVRVERVARTCGGRHVSMAGDGRRRDPRSRRPLVRAPRHERDLRPRGRVDGVALREPREGSVARFERRRRRRHRREVADEAHELVEALTAAGRVSCDRSCEAARTPFPHAAFAVDEEVVGDVVPALRARVERVHRGEDPRHLRGGVQCVLGGVVHEQESHVLGGERARRWPRRPRVTRPDRQAGSDGDGARGDTDASLRRRRDAGTTAAAAPAARRPRRDIPGRRSSGMCATVRTATRGGAHGHHGTHHRR